MTEKIILRIKSIKNKKILMVIRIKTMIRTTILIINSKGNSKRNTKNL